MKYFTPLLPFLLGWLVLLSTTDVSKLGLINGITQLILFALVVCLPIWRTGRMSYVDIGWPWGLVAIGMLTYLFSDGYGPRVILVSAVYIFIGLRMGLGALKMWRQGLLKKEFPRYQYQRLRWEKSGKTNLPLAMQIDALMQGLANASFLALPAFVIASNPAPSISIFEIVGLFVWIAAFAMESVADMQKLSFLRAMKQAGERNRVCDIGLWRYSRHPNYFAEWMVWTALVIASIPSWVALYSQESIAVWLLLGACLAFTSRVMYTTLVYATGAIPSEYFSAQKRPGYTDYQKTTNRFFPGPRKQSISQSSG
jgi:steroid 5-alpha reductase family enzyme